MTHFTRQGNMTSIVFLLSFQGGGAASQVKQTGGACTSELLKIFHNNISLGVIKTVLFLLAKVNSKVEDAANETAEWGQCVSTDECVYSKGKGWGQ